MMIDWRILGALMLVIVIAFAVLLVINADLRADVSIARSESAALHIDNAGFKTKLDQQNQAIEALRTEASARNQRAASLVKTTQTTVKNHLSAATKLENSKTSGDDCTASNALLSRYIQALQ